MPVDPPAVFVRKAFRRALAKLNIRAPFSEAVEDLD
jgi:hypothetical protein